jgi:hypothetical protein
VRKYIARIGAGVVAAGAAAALMVGMAGTALAGTGPTQTSPSGEAGYYITGDFSGFKYIQDSDYIRLADNQLNTFAGGPGAEADYTAGEFATAGEGGRTPGIVGIEACSNRFAVQEGYVRNEDGTFDVIYASGTIADEANCSRAGLLQSLDPDAQVYVLLTGLTQADTLHLRIARNSRFDGGARPDFRGRGGAGVLVEASSLLTGDVAEAETGWVHGLFTAEGAGVFSDAACMTDSLDNELVAARHDNVTDGNGVTGDFISADWTAYQLVANDSSNITYLSPDNSLAGARFKVYGGDHISNC